MPASSGDSSEPKRTYMRSGQRLNSQIKVTIEWEAGGQSFRETARTINVARAGCMAVIPRDVPLNQRVRLTNTLNNNSADAVVIWKGPKPLEGWECGLQLTVGPEIDFWDLDV